jgi:ADP-ribosyl-[dinitrogen reductase] hydrolase
LITKYNIEPLKNQIEETLLGLAIGDAMGVPVEFCSRETLQLDPVLGFQGFGTHIQLQGTFSDDSSLCFCLVESFIEGFTLDKLAQKIA